MRKWLVVSALLMASCVGRSSEESIATASPSAPVATASPTETLRCQLPVFSSSGIPGDTAHGPNGAGFVGFPGGEFTFDPTGNLSVYFNHTYDWAVLRWLPMWRDAVAPDGLHYFMPNNSTDQWDLVDARNDAHRALVATKDWNATSYQTEGIYLDKGGFLHGPPGLWLLDPSTAAIRKVSEQSWASIGAGAAWGFDGPGQQAPLVGTTLRRLDLKSGEVTTWFTSDGAAYRVYGNDQAGTPLLATIETSSPLGGISPVDIFVLTAPGQLVKIASPNADPFKPQADPVSDKHGIWFASGTRIWLYSKGSLAEVAKLSGNGAFMVAGNCSSRPA
jgi:hypothetical protein